MGIYPEKPSERNIDQLADDIRVVTELELRTEGYPNSRVLNDCTDGVPRTRELPPKYEDLDQPPKYDEQMFLATSLAEREPEANNTSDENTVPSYSSIIPNDAVVSANTIGNETPNRN